MDTETQTFDTVKILDIRDLGANLRIETTNRGAATTVEVTEPAVAAKAIKVELKGTKLEVSGGELNGGAAVVVDGNDIIVIGTSGGIQISGNTIVGAKRLKLPTVVIRTPASTELNLKNVYGSGQIGDLTTPAEIVWSSSRNLELGNLAEVHLVNKSMGEVAVNDVRGSARIESNGSGNVQIASIKGEMVSITTTSMGGVAVGPMECQTLTMVSKGSGNVNTGPVVSKLSTIETTSMGDVTVAKVQTQTMKVTSRGSGDVEIPKGEVKGELTVLTSSMGSFNFGGKALDASLTSKGSGDIEVEHVTNRPLMIKRSMGDITVGNWF